MNKPQMKHEVAIAQTNPSQRFIVLYATQDAVIEFKAFGQLSVVDGWTDRYHIFVDPRFDFQEVLAYIKKWE